MTNMREKINQMWKSGSSVKNIVAELSLNMKIPASIEDFTKETIVYWKDWSEKKTYAGKIISWETNSCVVEYLWNEYPVKRMIDKEYLQHLLTYRFTAKTDNNCE